MNGEHTKPIEARTEEQRADYENRRLEFLRSLPTYQRYDAMKLVREAARLLAEPGQKVIYRDAFRWHDDADELVMSNHYESMSLDCLARDFNYEVIHDFHHVAVVRRK